MQHTRKPQNRHASPDRPPRQSPLARAEPRCAAALFDPDAQRRQGRRSRSRKLGLPYEGHRLSFAHNDQFTPEFLALNPNNKIPAILDPHGPGGQPLGLFESGAILIYLAEKTGKFLSSDPRRRIETLQWLMWQMGGVGPMLGQFGYFHTFAGKEIDDKRPLERYRAESARLLRVLDGQLAGRDWITGDILIADIAVAPWMRTMLTALPRRARPAGLGSAGTRLRVVRALRGPARRATRRAGPGGDPDVSRSGVQRKLNIPLESAAPRVRQATLFRRAQVRRGPPLPMSRPLWQKGPTDPDGAVPCPISPPAGR